MTFPNAYKGVKRIFTAQLLSLVAALLIFINLTIILFSISNSSFSDSLLVTIGLFAIASAVLAFVAFFMQISGLVSAGKDENSFKTALWVSVVAIIISSISSIRGTNQAAGAINGLMRSASSVVSVLVMYFIITGIRNLATALNDSDMERRGKGIINSIAILLVISIIATILNMILGNAGSFIVGLLMVSAAAINVIISILFIVYVGKARTMLEK